MTHLCKGVLVVAALAVLLGHQLDSRAAGQEKADRRDVDGDPLTQGAVVRLGTLRLRHAGAVISVAVSPDGKQIASSGEDRTIRVWDAASGRQRWIFQSRESPTGPVLFSPDGATVVAAVGPAL
jgi:WD40 repeat protein